METWSLFTGNDILIGLIGAVGLISAVIVISSASGKVNRREVGLRTYLDMKEAQKALEDHVQEQEKSYQESQTK